MIHFKAYVGEVDENRLPDYFTYNAVAELKQSEQMFENFLNRLNPGIYTIVVNGKTLGIFDKQAE